MKNIEKLKQEQVELKERLHCIIDLMNSEEYFSISEGEKSLLNSQRFGMEMYLNALTTRIYGNTDMAFFSSALLPLAMSSIFSTSFTNNSSIEYLKKVAENADDEKKE